jgi:hypothetical protein
MCSPNSRVTEMSWFIHGLFTNLWISLSFNIEEIGTEVKWSLNGSRCHLFLRMTFVHSFVYPRIAHCTVVFICPKLGFSTCSCLWYLLLADHV